MTATNGDPVGTPERLRTTRVAVFDDLLEPAFATEAGRWLHHRDDQLVRHGDLPGLERFSWELPDVDEACPHLAPLRAAVLERLAEVDPGLEVEALDVHASLHHAGGHAVKMTRDTDEDPSRRWAWSYFLHTEPVMFSGGELEFLDGKRVDPKTNRLAIYPADVPRRIRRVSCWGREALHGRWAFYGWAHGKDLTT